MTSGLGNLWKPMIELSFELLAHHEAEAKKFNEIMMRKKPFKIVNRGKPIMMPLEYKEEDHGQ